MAGDPGAAGGAPPMVPPAAAPAGLTEDRVRQLIQESAGGGGQGAPKKKVDVGQEIYHVKRLLVGLYNVLGLSIPPDALLGDPAEDPYSTPEEAAADPASSSAKSAIKPGQPLEGASPSLAAAEGRSVAEANVQKAIERGAARLPYLPTAPYRGGLMPLRLHQRRK